MGSSEKSRFPGYDVLAKRNSPSWDDATRAVIDERLATPREPRFFDDVQWLTLKALCDRIVPQDSEQAPLPVPIAALVDAKLSADRGDGYRDARLPPLREAWRRGLEALDDASRSDFKLRFSSLGAARQIALLGRMQRGELAGTAWQGMPCDLFFSERVLHDICSAYYSHPQAWSEIGFGGPANPRGYVRLNADRHDPWEAAEAKPGHEARARKENERVG